MVVKGEFESFLGGRGKLPLDVVLLAGAVATRQL